MNCVIFGAGKIARGFVGHLLYLSGIPFTFIEKYAPLAELLNQRGEYTVNILGAPEKNCLVKGAKALTFEDEEAVVEAIANADTVFDAVGGKNLGDLVPFIAKGIERRAKIGGGDINFVTCENWKKPADILKDGVLQLLSPEGKKFFDEHVGMTESVIMRSGIEADKEQLAKDPLCVNVQDYWVLPIDASRVKGELPQIKGVEMIKEFGGFLERKFYTYNAANGTVSFLGAVKGYKILSDAAHDEFILKILDGVYKETSVALSKKHGFPLEEQLAFTLTSKKKLQDVKIVDFVERNARDPWRKLGPDDRLVGSARLVEAYGGTPENLSVSIAAAIYYENPEDEFAVKLKELREKEGVGEVLRQVCKIDPEENLGKLVLSKIEFLKKEGIIK